MHPLARANSSLSLVDLDGVEKSCQLVKWNNTKYISKCTRFPYAELLFCFWFCFAKVFTKLSMIIFTFCYILFLDILLLLLRISLRGMLLKFFIAKFRCCAIFSILNRWLLGLFLLSKYAFSIFLIINFLLKCILITDFCPVFQD